MPKLWPRDVDIPSNHFGVHKTASVSTSRVIFKIKYRQRHGVGHFKCCAISHNISNGLSSYPNGDHMQKLSPMEFDLPTYQFGVDITIAFHIIGSCLG